MKQKHYKTEQAILDKIDDRRTAATEFNANAELLEERSRVMIIRSKKLYETAKTGEELEEARNTLAMGMECKDNARKSRKRARRIEEVVLPALGETLSAFLTTPMIPILLTTIIQFRVMYENRHRRITTAHQSDVCPSPTRDGC